MSAAGDAREAFIDGIGLWTPELPGWELAAAALRCEHPAPSLSSGKTPARPTPKGLAPNERRRAPVSVLVALQVAEEAVAMSGHRAHELPSIFTSAHGDLPIIDALLRTVAEAPQLLSPTRFHHAVHNAPSGYWAMASGSHAASTALSGYGHSFAAGLLEALVQLATDEQPLLLVGCDTEAQGPLASVNTSRGLLGVALVIAARPSPRTQCLLRWQLKPAPPEAPAVHPTPCAQGSGVHPLSENAMADALPLFEALARGRSTQLPVACGPGLRLQLEVQPRPAEG